MPCSTATPTTALARVFSGCISPTMLARGLSSAAVESSWVYVLSPPPMLTYTLSRMLPVMTCANDLARSAIANALRRTTSRVRFGIARTSARRGRLSTRTVTCAPGILRCPSGLLACFYAALLKADALNDALDLVRRRAERADNFVRDRWHERVDTQAVGRQHFGAGRQGNLEHARRERLAADLVDFVPRLHTLRRHARFDAALHGDPRVDEAAGVVGDRLFAQDARAVRARLPGDAAADREDAAHTPLTDRWSTCHQITTNVSSPYKLSSQRASCGSTAGVIVT